jgi:HEAT repeat protein
VRESAAWGLGVTRSRKAEQPLLEVLANEEDPSVIANAKKSLAWLREHRDRP